MQVMNAGSSPLRLDFDDEPEQGEGGWVRRTEDVHLHSDGVKGEKEILVGQYNEILGGSSGPRYFYRASI